MLSCSYNVHVKWQCKKIQNIIPEIVAEQRLTGRIRKTACG